MRKIQKKCATSRYFVLKLSVLVGLGTTLAACKPAVESDPAPEVAAASATEEEPVLHCGNDGQLSADIYGAITTRLEWNKNELACNGMPRPGGRGARLRFAGIVGDGERHIAIIIAIPELTHDSSGTELESNVTLIEEGNGRFFSTPDLNNCLTDITSLVALGVSSGRYSISGVLYCVSPLPEINGKSSVSIPELHFSGLMDWGTS